MEISDKDVITRIKNGQIDHYSYIVQRYTASIYRYIQVKIKKKEDVEDLVQNSFIKFYKAIRNFDEKKKIYPYLVEIAKNELKMFYRSRKVTVPLNEEVVSDVKDEEALDENNLKKLTDEEKDLLMEIAEGYTYEEMARKLKMSLNTLKSKVRRARIKIRPLNK